MHKMFLMVDDLIDMDIVFDSTILWLWKQVTTTRSKSVRQLMFYIISCMYVSISDEIPYKHIKTKILYARETKLLFTHY